jgi:hypothetical protein
MPNVKLDLGRRIIIVIIIRISHWYGGELLGWAESTSCEDHNQL